MAIGSEYYLFGSSADAASGQLSKDIDIALAVTAESRVTALHRLSALARSEQRTANWKIDLYSPHLRSYGYNSRQSAELHFFILSKEQLHSNEHFPVSMKSKIRRITSHDLI